MFGTGCANLPEISIYASKMTLHFMKLYALKFVTMGFGIRILGESVNSERGLILV